MMSLKYYKYVGRIMQLLNADKVEMNCSYMTILLCYATTSLAVLYQDVMSVISERDKADVVLKEIAMVRDIIVNAIERYTDYYSRMAVLKLRLPNDRWRVGDALLGVDHATVLMQVENTRTSEMIRDRLLTKDAQLDKGFERDKHTERDVEMQRRKEHALRRAMVNGARGKSKTSNLESSFYGF